jgi:hypothetical protein
MTLFLSHHELAGGILHKGWDGKTNRTGGLKVHAPTWGGLRLKQSAAGVILVRICTSQYIRKGVTYACIVRTRTLLNPRTGYSYSTSYGVSVCMTSTLLLMQLAAGEAVGERILVIRRWRADASIPMTKKQAHVQPTTLAMASCSVG